MKTLPSVLIAAGALLGLSMLAWSQSGAPADPAAGTPQSFALLDPDNQVVGRYSIPPDSDILRHANAEEILYGKRLLNETARLLPDNVGGGLNCNSCHLSQGKTDHGANYFNTINSYPKVMPRAAAMVDMAGRVNGCFMRSMNGKPLPVDSAEMRAIIAYFTWLREDVPKALRVDTPSEGKIDTSLVPDPVRGKALYAAQCATCHGDDGEGMKDQFGDYIFPPLWGDESFNIGAGMARTYKAAAFVFYNMPMGVNHKLPIGQGGALTQQEAVDVAEYFTHMPRPDFAPKGNDWPKGNKPKDARY
ncbi:c-type cytochrome [Pseudothauera nasutitermitis]|uniref:C-type cytochrome n=1 Tax=Pseudothauera nasutitermitis TaxID=2565930 RepID=A0A4S4B1N0_9RHOO|nr:c-type cytochrome [Pseudothauera nasutitermitis]THF66426.1 c-type cytochrome [Pseudothauera nasutitermitis]